MGTLEGKVAFISGGARGQGRSHAVRLAEQGADIVTFDICAQIDSVTYDMATTDDLAQTINEVEATGRRIVARVADVRDVEAVRAVHQEGVDELGPIDIVLANAGIAPGGVSPPDEAWYDTLDVNASGVWNTVRVAIDPMVERGAGGSIVVTSSTGGMIGIPTNHAGVLAYVAAKNAVIGMMRSWANYLAPHNIRVNAVAPTTVNTPMIANNRVSMTVAEDPKLSNAWTNALPVGVIEAIDVTNTIAWLVSDEARYITGTVVPVDAGLVNKR
jgi:SDR family mycofactocin-dependent oxidoreductase